VNRPAGGRNLGNAVLFMKNVPFDLPSCDFSHSTCSAVTFSHFTHQMDEFIWIKREGILMADKVANATAKITKTNEEWRNQLTPEQYHVTREAGTEMPFTGKYWKTKEPGTYHCVGCGAPLFTSQTKFDSGTGWPSFYAPLDPANVEEITDTTHGMVRVEARCAHCGAHLGHVFEDGPAPTGVRYCMNSASLDLKSSSENK
jgi:peptide-methionine (R)-S-oxide reductase